MASASPSASYGGGKAVASTADGTTPGDPGSSLRYAVPIGAGLGMLAFASAPFAGGARPVPPWRIPLPGGRSITVDPARLGGLATRLRRLLPVRRP